MSPRLDGSTTISWCTRLVRFEYVVDKRRSVAFSRWDGTLAKALRSAITGNAAVPESEPIVVEAQPWSRVRPPPPQSPIRQRERPPPSRPRLPPYLPTYLPPLRQPSRQSR